jgi:parvulin-like peptidyl-prolyl isomerase
VIPHTKRLFAIALAGLIGLSGGCSLFHHDGPKRVEEAAYYAPSASVLTTAPSPIESPTGSGRPAAPASSQLPSSEAPLLADQVLSDTVLKNVRPPEQVVTGALSGGKATGSATTRRGVSVGQYVTLGGVMATVNGTPIFANKVLHTLEVALAAKARELEPRQFRGVASDLIRRQVTEYVNSELEFAAAQKSLEKDDRKFADFLTVRWRQEQVTAAGGSVEMTKRRYAQSGQDFDEELRNQYRLYMIRFYYERKIVPKIQVTAADMRGYYKANLDKKFTEHSEIEFQLIKVDARKAASPQAAQAKAKSLFERARSGEDFAVLAASSNDDARLARAKGAVGTIQRGAFALEKVEDACWKTAPGQVADLVEEGGNFYIARVTAKRLGTTRSFDDPAVQDEVKADLRTQQFRRLQSVNREALIQQAVITEVPGMNDTAVDMAMQRYATWRQ